VDGDVQVEYPEELAAMSFDEVRLRISIIGPKSSIDEFYKDEKRGVQSVEFTTPSEVQRQPFKREPMGAEPIYEFGIIFIAHVAAHLASHELDRLTERARAKGLKVTSSESSTATSQPGSDQADGDAASEP
jgi:hypothetical protein